MLEAGGRSAGGERLSHQGAYGRPVVAHQIPGVRIAAGRDEHPADLRPTQDAASDLLSDARIVARQGRVTDVVDAADPAIAEERIVDDELPAHQRLGGPGVAAAREYGVAVPDLAGVPLQPE